MTYNYASGLNGDISRLSSLSDSGGTLESYDYLGLGTVVRRSHPQPDLDLTFLGTGPGTRRAARSSADRLATISAGDQYVGLDSFGRVIDEHWKTTSATTDRFTYTYDRNSNRLTKGNSVDSDFDEAYTYDNLNQLTSFDRNTGDRTQAWDFDALGNWDSLTTDGGSPQTRTHNKQNEITAVSGATSPTFDANGNMTTDETGKQYVYDAWNRLKVVKNSGGTTLKTYVYDALGRRVTETAGGATTDFYYSASWQVLEERDAARTNDTKVRYVWSPVYVDAMILRDRDTADDGTLEERLWVQQDANFNVTALVDDNGDVVERYVYDPYGEVTVLDETWSVIGSSAYGWLHLHQGGRLDTVSGLYHFRNRDYSPTLGRWVTRDPIGYFSSDVNLYTYNNNAVTISQDPSGLVGSTRLLETHLNLGWTEPDTSNPRSRELGRLSGSTADVENSIGNINQNGLPSSLDCEDILDMYESVQESVNNRISNAALGMAGAPGLNRAHANPGHMYRIALEMTLLAVLRTELEFCYNRRRNPNSPRPRPRTNQEIQLLISQNRVNGSSEVMRLYQIYAPNDPSNRLNQQPSRILGEYLYPKPQPQILTRPGIPTPSYPSMSATPDRGAPFYPLRLPTPGENNPRVGRETEEERGRRWDREFEEHRRQQRERELELQRQRDIRIGRIFGGGVRVRR